MAGTRIRTLKPEILEDEKTAGLSDAGFRLFTSLVLLSDDWGNMRGDVRWLEGQVWWAHAERPNVLKLLIELSNAQLIVAYGVRGGTYLHLRGWEKHQRIDNRGKNRVPKPTDADCQPIQLDEDFADFRGFSPRNSAGSGRGIGEEEEGIVDVAAKPPLTKPNENKPTDTGKRKHRIPAEWQPRPEERRSAEAKGLDCDGEAAHFRDHHTAKGEAMLDWDAAFRTWLRNAVKFSRGNVRQGSLPTAPRKEQEL
jgi:hypothetical protein